MSATIRTVLHHEGVLMSTVNNIESEIAALPPNLRAEVLDFVQFVKQRHGLPVASAFVAAATDSGDSSFFQALESAGLVGCIKTDEQLSTSYKSKIDFSNKHGALP
jgi:ABC-type uncharacterized transport system permease subunit